MIAGVLRWLRNSFTKNLAMKIGAFVFAFLLWSYVVTFNNPERVKTLSDVPVSYLGAESLHERGLTSSEPLYDSLNTVSMSVKVRSEYMAGTTSSLVQASVDLTGITQPGKYTLPVRGSSEANFITVSNTMPSNVTLTIEESMEESVPVEVQLEGSQDPNLYYGLPRLSQSAVTVSGARSVIESVARAVCTVDVSDLEQTMTATLTPVLVSQDGETLPGTLFADVPSVIVEIPVYPKRTIELEPDYFAAQVTGVPEGYTISSVELEPTEVAVAGPQEVIDAIQHVSAGPMDVDDATSSVTLTDVPLALPDGVYAVMPPSVDVTVNIDVVESTKDYAGVAVSTKNLAEGLEAVLTPSAVDVEVIGAATAVEAVTVADVLPFVDLAGLAPGTHIVDIKFENEADLGVQLTPSARTIRVVVRETST